MDAEQEQPLCGSVRGAGWREGGGHDGLGGVRGGERVVDMLDNKTRAGRKVLPGKLYSLKYWPMWEYPSIRPARLLRGWVGNRMAYVNQCKP